MQNVGITKMLLGMERLGSAEHSAALLDSKDVRDEMSLIIQMDAPADMIAFKEKLDKHFAKFPRLRSRVVSIGEEFYLKEVTD